MSIHRVTADDWYVEEEVEDFGPGEEKKTYKTAVNTKTGERRALDHSHYEKVTREALEAYVELAFPKRGDIEPGRRTAFYSADIVQLAASLRAQANGEAA